MNPSLVVPDTAIPSRLGFYAQDQIILNRYFVFVVGGRYEHFKDRGFSGGVLSAEDSALTGRVGAVVKPRENISIYASFSNSYARPGILSQTPSADGPHPPERGRQFAAGAKTELLNKKLFITASIFQINKNDVLRPDPNLGPNGNNANAVLTVGAIRNRGFEFDMNGASWREILFGKTLGICAVAFALLAPVTALTLLLWVILSGWQIGADSLFRVSGLLASYTIYFIVCAFIAVLVSAFHKTSRAALTTLVVVWILFCIVMPKATQTLGSKLYPTPSKSQFEAGLEEEISQEGDGHNPDDPKFVKLREDTLREYNVARVEDLPFNYGGLVMAEAERISSKVFREHYEDLIETFRRQNRVTEIASFVNPYLAIRNLSMSLSGSDFDGYADFQTQAETYRYNLIQKMNELHKNEIKYENDRAQRVSSADFKNLPPFVFAAAARF